MARSVRERTAQWAREAKQAELGDRWSVITYLLAAGGTFASDTTRALGWGYVLAAGLVMRHVLRRRPRKTRPSGTLLQP